jgi:nitrate reductase delta subunit
MITREEDAKMVDDRRQLLKLISICLSYPDDDFFSSLNEIEGCLNRLEQPASGTIQTFICDLRRQSNLAVQEHYTSVFDLNPDTSLNFTYHLIGDGEERGRALADLQELYRRAGFETAVSELPDFLPLVLEFLAEVPIESKPPVLGRLGVAVAAVAKRLAETGSIYSGLLNLACTIMPEDTRTPAAPEADSATEEPRGIDDQLGAQG